MKTNFIMYMFLNLFICYGQKDTLTYNEVEINIINNQKVITYNGKIFNGYLKYINDLNKTDFEYIKNGKITSRKAKNKVQKNSYDINLKDYHEIDIKNLIQRDEQIVIGDCKNCDTASITLKKYYLKNKVYEGYIRSNDSIIYIKDGFLSAVRILNGGKVVEFFEVMYDKKNGLYKKYDSNGKLSVEGHYIANHKTGKWLIYNVNEYDIIFQQYRKDSKFGLWEYTKNGKTIRGELYDIAGVMEYYYVSEFNGDFELRTYFRNGNKSSIVKFYKGQIKEEIEP